MDCPLSDSGASSLIPVPDPGRPGVCRGELDDILGVVHQNDDAAGLCSIMKAALDDLHHAAFVCDEAARLVLSNASASALVGELDGITLKHRHICIQDCAARLKFLRILGADAIGNGSRDIRSDGALLIRRPSQLPAYQMVLKRMRCTENERISSSNTLWVVAVSDPARIAACTLRAFIDLYGLTPAEARLAHRLILGATLAEIAAGIKVKLPTVRSQLSSLFRKTGTRRQTELVRLFGTLPNLR